MTDDALALVVTAMPALAVGLPVVAGLIGLGRWLRAPAAERPHWRRAVLVSGVVAALVAAVAGAWLTWFWSGWAGELQLFGVALGAAIGVGVFVAGFGGYGLLGGRRLGPAGLVAVLVGPIALIGGPLWIGDLAQAELQRRAYSAREAETAARSSVLHLSVVSTEVDLTSDGASVAAARLTVVVRSDVAVDLQRDPNIVYPVFTLSAVSANPAYLSVEGPSRGPYHYAPGVATRYDLAFEWDGYGAAPPGPWNLQLFITRSDGEILKVSVAVDLGRRPAPTAR